MKYLPSIFLALCIVVASEGYMCPNRIIPRLPCEPAPKLDCMDNCNPSMGLGSEMNMGMPYHAPVQPAASMFQGYHQMGSYRAMPMSQSLEYPVQAHIGSYSAPNTNTYPIWSGASSYGSSFPYSTHEFDVNGASGLSAASFGSVGSVGSAGAIGSAWPVNSNAMSLSYPYSNWQANWQHLYPSASLPVQNQALTFSMPTQPAQAVLPAPLLQPMVQPTQPLVPAHQQPQENRAAKTKELEYKINVH